MEALLGIGGVVVGWLLSAVTNARKDRWRAMRAARLVRTEIDYNSRLLESLAATPTAPNLDRLPRHQAWESVGVEVLALTDREGLEMLAHAYWLVDDRFHGIRMLKRAHDEVQSRLVKLTDEDPDDPDVEELDMLLAHSREFGDALVQQGEEIRAHSLPALRSAGALLDRITGTK